MPGPRGRPRGIPAAFFTRKASRVRCEINSPLNLGGHGECHGDDGALHTAVELPVAFDRVQVDAFLRGQREDVTRMIADWIELSPEDAARAYNLVIDTYSPNGLPTEAQMRAYLELMQETANVPADATVDRLFDFTLARRVAAELGLPSQ